MRIESTNVNTPPPPVMPEGGSKVVSGAGRPREGAADAVAGFTPTSDLTKLLALVKEVPEVRAELVNDVSERAAVGELLSRTAATDTAAAMLDGQG